MSQDKITVNVSELAPKEIEAADMLVHLFKKMLALNTAQRFRVYKRWEMLRLIQPGDVKRWEAEIKRVSR